MADVATNAGIGTAVGTLSSERQPSPRPRSANRAARIAERPLLLGLRPLLTPARPENPDLEIVHGDGRSFHVRSGNGIVEEVDDVIYLAIPLRNVGAGLAVLQRYDVITDNPFREPRRRIDRGLDGRRDRNTARSRTSATSSATSTSPAATPAAGRRPHAIPRIPSTAKCSRRSPTTPSRSRSTSSTGTTRAGSTRSATST